MVEKPSVSAFQYFLQIENQLNIKKVMGRNVWMYFVSTVSTQIALNAFKDPCLVSRVSTYIVLMVWLKSPQSQLSKTFCGLKIG